MKLRYAVAALAALLLAPAARAQAPSGAPPADAGTGKVGILNFRAAIANTAEGKQAQAELQSQFAPRQTELENLRKQIDEAQNRLRTGERTLSDEERFRIQRQIEQWTRVGQRKQEDYQEDLNAAQEEVFQRIGSKMVEVIDRYSRENGLAFVLDASAMNVPFILFAAPQVNITQDIIRLYDQANPIRGAAPAPQQAPAQRPQPGQPRPQQQPPAGQKPPQQ
jgi:outer membrane protein